MLLPNSPPPPLLYEVERYAYHEEGDGSALALFAEGWAPCPACGRVARASVGVRERELAEYCMGCGADFLLVPDLEAAS